MSGFSVYDRSFAFLHNFDWILDFTLHRDEVLVLQQHHFFVLYSCPSQPGHLFSQSLMGSEECATMKGRGLNLGLICPPNLVQQCNFDVLIDEAELFNQCCVALDTAVQLPKLLVGYKRLLSAEHRTSSDEE